MTATTVVPEFPLPLLVAVAAMGGVIAFTKRKGLK
ncbi:MAG: PEFG-CTERM sorting domain-containing protein [Nitrososphaera sp.]